MQGENALIYTFIGLTFIVTVFITVYSGSDLMYIFSKERPHSFDKSRIPEYLAVVLSSVIPLAIYALFFTRNVGLVLQFVLCCMMVIAVAAVTVLYPKNDQHP